ncbi:MAG TPA: creatininase family protein [Halobacteriales archaeon]|nr:creatininase family protein [Halobacteriales archaeon]
MYIGDEAWPDLGPAFDAESLALVPLGSTEQHGPHLPLATDHLIAEGLAREAAERGDYFCTPTVNVGVSAHHRQFHGTMWVGAPEFRDYVESMTRNLAYHGVDRVVYVNAHGGNVNHLREVGRRLHVDEVAFAIPWMWDESIPELVDDLFEHNGPHGGPKETAMIQHLHPELVHDDRLEDARDGGLPIIEESDAYRFGTRTFFDAVDNSDNGVFGDQTDATAEKGEQLFEAAVEQLVQLCDWLDDQPFEDLMPAEHV